MFRNDLTTLVIDTNILLLLLGYQCLEFEKALGPHRARVLTDIRARGDSLSPERFNDLWQLYHLARRRIVTQHVIAETYGRRGYLPFRKDVIWRSAFRIVEDPRFEEEHCSIAKLRQTPGYEKILTVLGPTDAGLLFIAERNKATILTDDEQLLSWAEVRKLRALPLSRIGHSG